MAMSATLQIIHNWPEFSICCRYEHYYISVHGFIKDAPAACAIPFMSVIKKIRPVGRPFINIKGICTIRKQDFVHFFEIFGLVSSAMNYI